MMTRFRCRVVVLKCQDISVSILLRVSAAEGKISVAMARVWGLVGGEIRI